jgi:hypothetical protein
MDIRTSGWWTRRAVIGGGLILYVFGIGLVSGIAIERVRFTEVRSAILRRHEEALRALHARLMLFEKRSEIGGAP